MLFRVRSQEETTDHFRVPCNPKMGKMPQNLRMLNFASGKAVHVLIIVNRGRRRRKYLYLFSFSENKLQGHSTYTVNF